MGFYPGTEPAIFHGGVTARSILGAAMPPRRIAAGASRTSGYIGTVSPASAHSIRSSPSRQRPVTYCIPRRYCLKSPYLSQPFLSPNGSPSCTYTRGCQDSLRLASPLQTRSYQFATPIHQAPNILATKQKKQPAIPSHAKEKERKGKKERKKDPQLLRRLPSAPGTQTFDQTR